MSNPITRQTLDLALQHHRAARLREAEQLYEQILAREPGNVEARHLLGVLAAQLGRFNVAVDLIRQAIALRPNCPEAFNDLGSALIGMARLDDAIAAFHKATTLKPDYPEAHFNLANALSDKGHANPALVEYRQAIALRPGYAEAHNNLGNVLKNIGQLDQAIAAYRKAVALRPTHPQGHFNLANALADQRQFDAAIAAYGQAIALNPNYAEAFYNLGSALKDTSRLDDAITAFQQAITLRPNFPEAHNNFGGACLRTGHHDQAIAMYRKAIALKPRDSAAHSNLVHGLHYHPDYDARSIADEHFRWHRQHAQPLAKFMQPHANDRSPHRRLRIGYVSTDFRDHAVGRFLLPLIEHHDKSRVEVFAYALVTEPDAVTKRIASHVDGWRNLVGVSDESADDLIRRDKIDILVDLCGHMAQGRLLLFARKPAPVQVTYLGYPDTTGLTAIDYRLTDAFADPPGQTETFHSEKLVRLSPCAWCFAPPPSPSISPRPPGPITFGCFNNFAKITELMLKLWGQILSGVTNSRLLLKSAGLTNPSARQKVQRVLAESGIATDRLDLRGETPNFADHLNLYTTVDIALDTFPYHGTTTTCEAMWMGVPVVTLAGQTHVARVGVSLLNNVGLPELVARNPQEYVHIAVELASDPARRADLRQTLRQRMQASPLMDAKKFASNVEGAFRVMWRDWCVRTC